MALVLNEEQRLLQDTAREFLKSNAPVEALRQLRDSAELCRADRGKIFGMRKQDRPAITNPIM